MTTLLPQPEPPDPVEGALGHFDHSNWVKASLHALDAGTMRAAGNVPVAGDLIVDNPSSQEADIRLRGDSNTSIWSETSTGLARWREVLGDATAETGADSGSLYKLNAYADNGTVKHTVLQADRASGLVTVKADPTAPLGIATKQYVDAYMPIGAIVAYGGSNAPAGWHLCNGTAHGSAALKAVIGSDNTPNLSGRFIVGAGTGYNPNSTGGVESVTLSAAQSGMPSHAHTAASSGEGEEHQHLIDPPNAGTSGQNADHSHSGTTSWMDRNASHTHAALTREGDTASGDSEWWIDTSNGDGGVVRWNTVQVQQTDTNHLHGFGTGGVSADHAHYVDIPAFWSGGRSAVHSHAISVAAAAAQNATAAHENRPPYYALVYIIRKG